MVLGFASPPPIGTYCQISMEGLVIQDRMASSFDWQLGSSDTGIQIAVQFDYFAVNGLIFLELLSQFT